MNKIVKPFGVSVEAAFCRIKTLTSLFSYFPPPSSRGKMATASQSKAFENEEEISNKNKREMKYNLLISINIIKALSTISVLKANDGPSTFNEWKTDVATVLLDNSEWCTFVTSFDPITFIMPPLIPFLAP